MLELNSDDNEYNETDKPKNKSESGQSPLYNSSNLLSSISKVTAEKMIGESEPLKDVTGESCRRSFVNQRGNCERNMRTHSKNNLRQLPRLSVKL